MTQKKNSSPQIKDIDLPSRIQNFNKRWNFTSDDPENSRKFKNRILVAVDRTVGDYLLSNSNIANEYAFLLGYDLPPSAATGDFNFDALILGVKFQDNPIYKILAGATEFRNFITSLQALFWILEKYNCPYINELADKIQLAIDYSPNVSLRIVKKKDTVTIYPDGAKILDEKLVNEPLLWLENKPSVAKHYEQALSIYLSKDESKYRNLLDNLRLSLEQLLRTVLGTKLLPPKGGRFGKRLKVA
jgi:hypothetical protein